MNDNANANTNDDQGALDLSPENDEVEARNTIRKCLLQYLFALQGVCHENILLLALMHITKDLGCFNESWTLDQWMFHLQELIDQINIKLNSLLYKVVITRHATGKAAVGEEMRSGVQYLLEQLEESLGSKLMFSLPDSNRFYVYVNLQPTFETKVATRFDPKEIEFIKWSLDRFVEAGDEIYEVQSDMLSAPVVRQVRRALVDVVGNNTGSIGTGANGELDGISWTRYITYTVGSTSLEQFEGMTAIEIESLLSRLCEYKWFYRTGRGFFGMDLRCITELEEYLYSNYPLPLCQVCDSLVLQGVTCGNNEGHVEIMDETGEDEEEDYETVRARRKRAWHVDCFQHYITHVGRNCHICQHSLLEDGIYIV